MTTSAGEHGKCSACGRGSGLHHDMCPVGLDLDCDEQARLRAGAAREVKHWLLHNPLAPGFVLNLIYLALSGLEWWGL